VQSLGDVGKGRCELLSCHVDTTPNDRVSFCCPPHGGDMYLGVVRVGEGSIDGGANVSQ
jgi:hypothetical protein